MKQTGRIVLCVLCGLLILVAPFLISSPNLLSEVKWELMDQLNTEEGEELDLGRLLFPSARAEGDSGEDLIEEIVEEGDSDLGPALYELPVDFSVPPLPKEENYSENGYEDATIRVRMEDREEDGVIWHLAFVQIASPTQLRTATAISADLNELYASGDQSAVEKQLKKVLTSSKVSSVSGMARNNHAVVAINGDNFVDKPEKTTFEYRMGQKIRSKTNKTKDMLIIDENGDFHLILAQEKKAQTAALEAVAAEHDIVNAYTFGPALVIDGEECQVSSEYGYNPNGREPRAALGQIGRLSYVLAIAEGRGSSSGVTQQELAHFMAELECRQAFNLDGGNSAEMVFNGVKYKGMPGGDERGLSDILYFATAVPEE
ncbi:MAG: phosphodiester glycosidase family protein [Clostridia bacterium]|nr:phosphodiester glycosidase family protein [Clostridia bacterium]